MPQSPTTHLITPCRLLFFTWLCVLLASAPAPAAAAPDAAALRAEARKHLDDGNYKEAYVRFRQLTLDADVAATPQAGQDLGQAIHCLTQLNRVNEIDALREQAIATHGDSWRLLAAAARSYLDVQHDGFIISGQFVRGPHRGGGQHAHSWQRDRIRALQLFAAAVARADARAAPATDRARLYIDYATAFTWRYGHHAPWRLQILSQLDQLPDYGAGYAHHGYSQGPRAAPANADGTPVYFHLPQDFAGAANDGERWRWLLQRALEIDPTQRARTLYLRAQLLRNLYGVQTLAGQIRPMARHRHSSPHHAKADDDAPSSAYAVRTLAENETIARLAAGVKRFTLPDESNYIRLLQSILELPGDSHRTSALHMLAEIFENRQQYPKAAAQWRALLALDPANKQRYQQRLKAIVGHWGRFATGRPQAAGQAATVTYRFRNAHKLELEAHRIDVPALLHDIKTYLRNNPGHPDYRKIRLDHIGYRLVEENQKQYLRERVARWTEILEPPADHFDAQIEIRTPLQKAGAYLLTARLPGGNTSRIIVWLNDTALVRKPLHKQQLYYVADARSGAPVAGVEVNFFGYRTEAVEAPKPLDKVRYKTKVRQVKRRSDADGLVVVDIDHEYQDHQWMVTASGKDGRLAYLGFQRVWYSQYRQTEFNQTKPLAITDRPVYRPGQTVKFRAWVRTARYDGPDDSSYAKRPVTLRISNPKNEKVWEQALHTDTYGSVQGELALPDNAALGQYTIEFTDHGHASQFRVEEYKKPEFEVQVSAPPKPVRLGEVIAVDITAHYYFGAPVGQAQVKYKVLRYSQTDRWYPSNPWDWLYGKGYWWSAYDYAWYPGWIHWGHPPPRSIWRPRPAAPPELVMENQVPLGADGKVNIKIDTALAKALHGDTDHRYEIVAEVTDASRRTIVGSGQVLAGRSAFQVYTWVDHGYYRQGDPVQAHFQTRTLDGQPVAGQGQADLFKIRYDSKGKPTETPVQSWPLTVNASGRAQQGLRAGAPGQYRIALRLRDAAGNEREGAYIFTVVGSDAKTTQDSRFNPLELIAQQRNYAPGERAELLINTARPNSIVLLFARPVNGVYKKPKILHLKGQSALHTLAVSVADMPNFYVEAVTINDGRVYTQIKEITVPPQSRTLNVSVQPAKPQYLPGESAELRLEVTDQQGRPVTGSTVISVYDKAVEYIAGGSNIPDLRVHFWQWRRQHYSRQTSNLDRYFPNLQHSTETAMRRLGVLGDLLTTGSESERDAALINRQARRNRGPFSGPLGALSSKCGEGKCGLAMRAESLDADLAVDPAPRPGVPTSKGKANPASPFAAPTVRKQFADTAYWNAQVELDAAGSAVLRFPMPENLTTWKIQAWSLTHGTRVGQAGAEVITKKNLLVRLQAPRFFIEKDEVVLSANIHNYLADAKKVKAVLELDGPQLEATGALSRTISVAAQGEQRVDWRVKVRHAGEAVIRMQALSDTESDAVEMRFPVYVHGMAKTVSYTGSLRADVDNGGFSFDIPQERRPADTRFELRYSPSLAGAMVDALPYLVDYPYGCTEQTLSRFLPTVITQNILQRMGLDLKEIQNKRSNLNAQELGSAGERAQQWRRRDRNPVFDPDEVAKMARHGLQRLAAMQVSDGGWGWFSGRGERAFPHTTAYVVHGLQLAKANGLAVPDEVLTRGLAWLAQYRSQRLGKMQAADKDPKRGRIHADNLDAFVYLVLSQASRPEAAMRQRLYDDRKQLSVYAKAMLGLALAKEKQQPQLDMVLSNIEQYLIMDAENQTAYLKLPNNGYWWYWYGSEVEAHAYYLKLLARTQPKSDKARWLVKYLINNRKHATYWNSTRDTAIAIEALAEYMTASGETTPNMQISIAIDGRVEKQITIDQTNLLSFDDRLVLKGNALKAGKHTVEIRKTGTGPLYYNGYLSYFSLEDYIPRAGLEVKVQRKFYRLDPVRKTAAVAGAHGQALEQRVEQYRRTEIADLATLTSGQLVEVELTIDSKNDYEYLIFEDMKAAGFEPVEVRSGYNGNALGAYVEYRDERVSFFVRQLARGRHSVAYRLRAEIPGKFSALPTRVYAMYAPELKANSDEIKLQIQDR